MTKSADDPVVNERVVNERAQHFLKVLIDRYIRDGQPIGSRTLSRDRSIDLSPATIRNVMSDLEDAGLITSPHTSSGRIPTISGYRFFIDYLISLQEMSSKEVQELHKALGSKRHSKTLFERTSNTLSSLTKMAGLVMIPKHEHIFFHQIEFVHLDTGRILVILVTSDGEVQNKVIENTNEFSHSELVQAQNYLNQHYTGKTLDSIRQAVIDELAKTRDQMDKVMQQALTMAGEVLNHESDEDFVLSGQTNLMDFHELADVDRLRELFDSFAEKRQILHLLDRCLEADGVQLFIGEESQYRPFDNCTLVTAPYQSDGRVAGVLGVIGPTRMEYNKVIPIVDLTAQFLSSVMQSKDTL